MCKKRHEVETKVSTLKPIVLKSPTLGTYMKILGLGNQPPVNLSKSLSKLNPS